MTNLLTKLFVKNFRRGFATNSSSSHSFVYLKEPVEDHDADCIEETEFGWNDFTLTTLRSKLFYVLCGRISQGYWDYNEEDIDKEAAEKYEELKDEFPEFDVNDFRAAILNYGVDHQSRGRIDIEQARDPRVVVFGGNDNSDGSYNRKAYVSSDLIDWSATEVKYMDEPPRSDFPFWEGDHVKVAGDDREWRVMDTTYHPEEVKVSHAYQDNSGRWIFDRATFPVGVLTLVSERTW